MPVPTVPANPPAHHGKEGVLALAVDDGVAVPAAVALLSEWTLDMATDKVETTALGDANKTYVQGLKDVKGTFSGFWDSVDDLLFEAAESDKGVKMEIWPSKLSAVCFAGPAWLDVSIKGGVTSAVTVDGTFSAKGAWTRTPPAVGP
jgi:hypothetical protein